MPQTIDNMGAIWSNSLTTYTFLKTNITGPGGGAEQSAAGSLLMDLQVGGSSRFSVSKFGVLTAANRLDVQGISVCFQGQAGTLAWSGDTFITRRAAANLRLGAADAAAPVAQTLSVQSGTAGASALSCSISGTTLTVGGAVTGTIAIGHAVTGTGVSAGTVITAGSGTTWTVNNSQTVSSTTMYFNSVGQNLTITGSQGSGPSAGGSIVFQVAPAGSAATTAQNALATALTINSDRSISLNGIAGNAKIYDGGFLNSLAFSVANGTFGFAYNATYGFLVNQGSPIAWASSAQSSPVLALWRDADNTLALRNGANAQTFRVYNTTDGTNSELLAIAWSGNTCYIEAGKTGTGNARPLWVGTGGSADFSLYTNGNTRWYITGSTGHFLAGTDNTYDIGASGASRPRNIYAAGSATISGDVTVGGGSGLALTNGPAVLVGANARMELIEVTAPAAPAANRVRIYAEDNGSGKTRLMALFPTGAAVQIAIEP